MLRPPPRQQLNGRLSVDTGSIAGTPGHPVHPLPENVHINHAFEYIRRTSDKALTKYTPKSSVLLGRASSQTSESQDRFNDTPHQEIFSSSLKASQSELRKGKDWLRIR